jgi:UDP-N-acetylmuramoyl-L-alanyl-D-glutamate--2,6-diaminopimelate ligase
MQRLWDVGLDLLWLEAFSNTLSQGVFDGVEVDVAVFTQAGVDHVGTHGSLAAYWAAKDRLFETVVRSNGVVVIDPTAPGADRILDIAARRQLKMVTTGAGQTVELTATTIRIGSHTLGGRMPVCETVMVQNLELAIGAALALELDMRQVAQACARLTGPPGRFQEVDLPAPFRIVIDAAHNADALEALLRELEVLTSGRLLLLIGSVGTADLVRWEPLGEVADVFADIVVITDESPYRLDAATIRAAIRRGCPRAVEIPDRREGVQWLVAQARPGDTVVVAGRADEDFVVDEHGAVPYPIDAELLRAAVGSPSSARPVNREGDQASDQLGVQDAGPPS